MVGRAGKVNTGHLIVTKQKKRGRSQGQDNSLLKYIFSDSPPPASLCLLEFAELLTVVPPSGNQALNPGACEGHFLSEHNNVSWAVAVVVHLGGKARSLSLRTARSIQ